jgi:F0F1-type ATP synthase membrane subunit b/b'
VSLRGLLKAARALETAQQRTDELRREREKLRARLDEVDALIAAARADSAKSLDDVKREAIDVVAD